MSNKFVNRAATFVVAVCIVLLPVMQTATAAIIQTEAAIEISEPRPFHGNAGERRAVGEGRDSPAPASDAS